MPKRKAKEDKWYFVEDPGNEDKVLKFPKRLQAFIEKEPTPYETHFVDHTDRFTGFKSSGSKSESAKAKNICNKAEGKLFASLIFR